MELYEIGTVEKSKKHVCNCGNEKSEGIPELDVRVIAHEIRHGAVLGALESLKPGKAMILVANHEPLPLLKQIDRKFPDLFTRTNVEEGPEVWKIQFTRAS